MSIYIKSLHLFGSFPDDLCSCVGRMEAESNQKQQTKLPAQFGIMIRQRQQSRPAFIKWSAWLLYEPNNAWTVNQYF